MKIYSNEAVTSTAVNELDAKQTAQIKKLKNYCAMLLAGEALLVMVMIGLHIT